MRKIISKLIDVYFLPKNWSIKNPDATFVEVSPPEVLANHSNVCVVCYLLGNGDCVTQLGFAEDAPIRKART